MKGGIVGAMCWSMALLGACGDPAHAQTAAAPDERAALVTLLQRADISPRLEVMGHNPRLAGRRVAAMSDIEVRALSDRVRALAGAGDERLRTFAMALMLSTRFGGAQR
jgi:hypothetical protein